MISGRVPKTHRTFGLLERESLSDGSGASVWSCGTWSSDTEIGAVDLFDIGVLA